MVPLSRIHHRAAHRAGDERAWWTAGGIDPVKVARKLWKETLADKRLKRPHVSVQVGQINAQSNAASDATKASE